MNPIAEASEGEDARSGDEMKRKEVNEHIFLTLIGSIIFVLSWAALNYLSNGRLEINWTPALAGLFAAGAIYLATRNRTSD